MPLFWHIFWWEFVSSVGFQFWACFYRALTSHSILENVSVFEFLFQIDFFQFNFFFNKINSTFLYHMKLNKVRYTTNGGIHRAILLEATSYIHVIRKLWESWPTRVGSNIVTSVNSHKYILLMYQKNVCLKKTKKVLYLIKCTSFNDVLRSVFIYFLPWQYKNTFVFLFCKSEWREIFWIRFMGCFMI